MNELLQAFIASDITFKYYSEYYIFIKLIWRDSWIKSDLDSCPAVDLYNWLCGADIILDLPNKKLSEFLNNIRVKESDASYIRRKVLDALDNMQSLFEPECTDTSKIFEYSSKSVSETDTNPANMDLSEMISILEDYKYELSYEDLKRCGRICDSVLINNLLAENGIDNVTYDDLMKYIKG